MPRRASRGSTPPRCAVLSDERGVASVEYALLIGLVALGAALALIGLGALLLALFRYQQLILLLPFS